jgi:Na+/H+ antiporter NhaD/arsenite permease-like protein
MNRATIALVGSSALILAGAISIEEAFNAVDIDTIILLFSMMVLNINLRLSGFFNIITSKVISIARTPCQFLGLFIITDTLNSFLISSL